jgi:hypothetical protein
MNVFLAGALVVAFPGWAMAQIAVLQIKVLEGEGAVHAAGARIARPLMVEVTDETGKPVPGAAVSFQLPPEGPSGLFSNGLRTDLVLTDASGRASIHSVQLNRTGGPFRIRITAVKEQARAGAVSTQFIGENRTAAPVKTAKAVPAVPASPSPASAPSGEITPAVPTTVRSGEITPTTAKMGSGSHKKWIVLATIVAAGAGVAFLGVTRAKSGSNSTVSSSVVSIGTPTVIIGNP